MEGESDAPPGTFVSVVAGDGNSGAVTPDGALQFWGYLPCSMELLFPDPPYVQADLVDSHACAVAVDGVGTCSEYNFVEIPDTLLYKHLAVSSNHVCGLLTDGNVQCWTLVMPGVSTPPAGSFVQVSAGENHSCGLLEDGSLRCWGCLQEDRGQCDPPEGAGFVAVSDGFAHSCALDIDGHITCWGSNNAGELDPP